IFIFFFSSRRRHTRFSRDWSSDVCSSDLKGYWGRRSNVYTVAKHSVEKGLQYQYRDRKTRKRNFRRLWIARINAAARQNGTTYRSEERRVGKERKSPRTTSHSEEIKQYTT